MNTLAIVGAVLGFVMTAGGVGALVWAVSHARGIEASLQLMTLANTELRADNADLRTKVSDERIECAREIARIEGQLQILTEGLAERIASAAISAFHDPERRGGISH